MASALALALAAGPWSQRHGMMRRAPSHQAGPLALRRVLLSRSWTLSLVVRASKGGPLEGQPAYSDMLQQREYELWQRQSRLYDQLLEQQERDRQQWEAERQRWAQQEASLKQEVAELRAQLLYLLQSSAQGSRTSAAPAVSTAASSSNSSSSSVYAQPPPLPGRPAGQLPMGTAGLSAAEQVRAVVEAVISGGAPFGSAGAAAAGPSGGEGPGEQGALPRYAAELAAAVAAVNEMDVLTDDLDFGALADRLMQQAGWAPAQQEAPQAPQPAAAAAAGAPAAAAQALPPAPAAAAVPRSAPAEQQQPQQREQAAEEREARGAAVPAPGPRPSLVSGSDDIYWMNELHRALVGAGYYPGDEDIDDFFFGESTLSAVMTLQACQGIPETGVVDEATWEALLAALSDAEEEGPDSTSVAAPVSAPASSATATTSSGGSSGSSGQKPYDQLFSLALGQQAQRGGGGGLAPHAVRVVQEVTITDSVQSVGGGAVQETIVIEEETRVEAVAAPGAARTAWPVLMEGDGGREVHALQVVLQQNGCYPSDEDAQWWQFGDSTLAALKAFQACNGLPESGVSDPATWLALMGADATPDDMYSLRAEDSADEEDLAEGNGRVWLMGEQRWEDKGRLKQR